MTSPPCQFVFLPGVDNSAQDLADFSLGLDGYSFAFIPYPGWRRYAAFGFSADDLARELAVDIAQKVPVGPIRILGFSIGGHLGYAAALHLQAMSREVEVLCVIDSYIGGAELALEWSGARNARILTEARALLFGGNLVELRTYVQERFWRGLFRVGGRRLEGFLARVLRKRGNPSSGLDSSLVEQEWSMHLLLRHTKYWVSKLDQPAIPLNVRTICLRTPVTSSDDELWRKRCPQATFHELVGVHEKLLKIECIEGVRNQFVSATSQIPDSVTSSSSANCEGLPR
jgi:thioesterase domain-containing protein